MHAFSKVRAVAAALPQANVDTDQIMPKQFLKGIDRTGLSAGFLFDLRFSAPGVERPGFVLNCEPWRQAGILLTGPNFGCGSSREHAVWGLRELGLRCVVGSTFGGIFADNCARNGVPAIGIEAKELQRLMRLASDPDTCEMCVDLNAQTIASPADGQCIRFEFDALHRRMLLQGLDAVGLTLERETDIDRFEAQYLAERPWLT